MKTKKFTRIILRIILSVVFLCLILYIIFFDHVYDSVYSSGKSNSKSIANAINYAIYTGEISDLPTDTVMYGYCYADKFIINSINDQEIKSDFESKGSNMGNGLYWAVSIYNNKVVSSWTSYKDLLNNSTLIPYSYGEQQNLYTILSKEFIGYYCFYDSI